MKRMIVMGVAGVFTLLVVARVAPDLTAQARGAEPLPRTAPLSVPAGAGSGMYGLSPDGKGGAYLVWLQPAGGGTLEPGQTRRQHELRFSRLVDGMWTPAVVIAAARNWFVNWADHPTIAVLPDGTLAVHWLVNNDGKQGSYGYGLRIALSRDRGQTWTEAFSAGTDNVRGYSGFATLLPGPRGLEAFFLTPPAAERGAAAQQHEEGDHGGGHGMTLSMVSLTATGTAGAERVLDADTCTCCTTSAVRTPTGVVVAYRDHAPGEIRDIAVVRQVDGKWLPPQVVHHDGWRIAGCPTNGPVLAVSGRTVALGWFTGAQDKPRVQVAFSSDVGATFAPPVVIDGGQPVGWPAVASLGDGSVAVVWVESRGAGIGELRLRRVWPDGRLSEPSVVAAVAPGRTTGIPQTVRTADGLVVVWRSSERLVSARVSWPAK